MHPPSALLLAILFAVGCATAPDGDRAHDAPRESAPVVARAPSCAEIAAHHARLTERMDPGRAGDVAARNSDSRRVAASETRAKRMGCSLDGSSQTQRQ